MRKALKIVHSLASCGMIGALLAYMVLLIHGPHDTAARYADMRASINVICTYVLLPSLAAVLLSGLVSMAVHTPFRDLGWVWLKAGSGIGMFEATLLLINRKAGYAAQLSAEIAAGETDASALAEVLSNEWGALGVVVVVSVANVVVGVWRPSLSPRPASRPTSIPPDTDAETLNAASASPSRPEPESRK